jgi:DNA-binding NtrC family response regulator
MHEKVHVLVVDDDERIRQLLMDTLSALGYNTIGAPDGNEALSILKKRNIDLVIADIRMPQMNGIDLLKAIKNSQPALPVLIITGYDYNYAMDQAMEAGADGFLAKPFRIGKIEELMRNVLGKRSEDDEKKMEIPRRILVAEDNEKLRNILVETLISLDYLAQGVESGEQALEKLKTDKFDLLITDVKMPRMDGITLLKELKKIGKKIPVVMITAYPQVYPAQKALKEGADGYLSKPFRVEKIDELMRILLEDKEGTTGIKVAKT